MRSSPERTPSFFDFAAEAGLTKHFGGSRATDELVAMCGVRAGDLVLDVGCGVGQTACSLAVRYGVRVVGVDILDRMVERCLERAFKLGVEGQVTFRTADAQALPFRDDYFDHVLTESVTVFPPDKKTAVQEYVRVTKPDGSVGLNEGTWLRPNPPQEITAWLGREIGGDAQPLTAESWVALLEGAGLQDIETRIREVQVRKEAWALVQRYGLVAFLRSLRRMMGMYRRSQSYRAFVQQVRKEGGLPEGAWDWIGFGLFVGKKPPKSGTHRVRPAGMQAQ